MSSKNPNELQSMISQPLANNKYLPYLNNMVYNVPQNIPKSELGLPPGFENSPNKMNYG